MKLDVPLLVEVGSGELGIRLTNGSANNAFYVS